MTNLSTYEAKPMHFPDTQHFLTSVEGVLENFLDPVNNVPLPDIEGLLTDVFDTSQTIAVEDEEIIKGWLSRYKTKLAVGATVTSIAATSLTDPFSKTKHELYTAAKWVLPSGLLAETVWIGGGAMMLAAIGSKIKNPFKIKKMIPEIADQANKSLLFKSGFWINTTAAVAEFGIITSGVTTELPAKSWGLTAYGFVDLGITIAVRRAIRKGIRNNITQPTE